MRKTSAVLGSALFFAAAPTSLAGLFVTGQVLHVDGEITASR